METPETIEERLREAIKRLNRFPSYKVTVKAEIKTKKLEGLIVSLTPLDFGTEEVQKVRTFLVNRNNVLRLTEEDTANIIAEIIKERAHR